MSMFNNKNIELVYNIHNFKRISKLASYPLKDYDEKKLFNNNIILYVGGLYHNIKGTDRLIKAFAKIQSEIPQYKLVFIGEDKDNSLPLLYELALKYSSHEAVYFLGKKSNPYQYMKNAQMLVSPSRDEGLPGVLIEALSLGIKCVATNSSEGIWEIMQCDKDYDQNLNMIRKTDFGYITPNIIDDEEFTVTCLAEAMRQCLLSEFDINASFDKSRFSEERIIPHYLTKERCV